MAKEGIKLLNTWLEGERSYNFCKFIGSNTAKLRPDEVPHSETWPFLISLLIKSASAEISSSKRRNPKMIYAKTLRIVVQRAEDAKCSGKMLPLSSVVKPLFNHVWDVLSNVPSFQSEYGIILRHLLSVRDYSFQMRKRIYCNLVFLYIEKVEASLNGKNISNCTSKEEVFRYILTLHSLLKYPPGDYPDNAREDIVKGFVRICSFIREEGKISRKLVECINTYLLNDGPNLGFQLFEIHNAMQQFVFRSWLTTHDRVLKDSLVFYARIQLNLISGAADRCLLVEQLLDVICKDLDQGSMSSTSMLRGDGNKDDKLGALSSSQCGLVELAAVLFYRGQLIQNGLKWKVGSRDKIKFWEDRRICGEESLAEKFPRLYLISLQQQQLIQQMGSHKDNGWEWNFTWRRTLFENEIDLAVNFLNEIQHKTIQQQETDVGSHNDSGWEWNFTWTRALFDNEVDWAVSFLNELQHRTIQQQGSDMWEWTGDQTGQYSAHNGYKMLMEESVGESREDCFDKLWSAMVPSKITVFAWRLIIDRLPTKKNLQRRQVQLTDTLCPFCRNSEEDSAHLFLHCDRIQPIWWETISWLNLKGAVPFTPKQHFLQHIDVQADGVRMQRWQCWWLALTWSTWKLRNSIVFSNATFNANILFEDAIFTLWTWLRHFEKDFTTHFNQWSSMPEYNQILIKWRSRGERGISEHRGWHNKNEKEDSYDKDGNWTKVTSKRSAKERKKKILEKRSPDKHATWREPTYHQPNWRNKDDITSFYFTHFADDVTEVRLWENFKKWGDVREVYIAKRRNKDGRRYDFVRFKGVSDAKCLEVQLDNTFINDQKLFVNLPRFARSTRTHPVQTTIANGGESIKDLSKYREQSSRPRLRSYAEVTAQGGASEGMVIGAGTTTFISIPPNKGGDYWCSGTWVGKLKKPMSMECVEDRISWDFGYNICTKFLGDDMVLLTGLFDDRAHQLILSEIDGGKSIFYSLEKWRSGLKPNNRLRGFPIEAWDTEHMTKVVSCIDDVIEPDDDTEDRRRLDRARMLVRTPLPPTINREVIVRVGINEYKVWMVEEVGDDGDTKRKRSLLAGDWTDDVPSDDECDGAADDDSDTTFSFSPELSTKKMLQRSNHWSHDITSGLRREPSGQDTSLGNNRSDDNCRENAEVTTTPNQGLLLAKVDPEGWVEALNGPLSGIWWGNSKLICFVFKKLRGNLWIELAANLCGDNLAWLGNGNLLSMLLGGSSVLGIIILFRLTFVNLFDSEMGIASKFIDQISAIRLNSNLKDTWVWRADSSGIFSTKSAYQASEVQQLAFQQLWDIKIPPRALSFAWRLLWDRLPTKDNLARRQIHMDSDLCPFCNSKPESASHLFFTCDKIQPLWWEFLSWVKEHSPTAGSLATARRWKLWWLAATNTIWKLRNDIIFHNSILFLMWTWLKGWERDFNVPFFQWASAIILNSANVDRIYDGLLWTLRSLQELSSVLLLPNLGTEISSMPSSTLNEFIHGWQLLWSTVVHGLPIFSNINALVDAALLLLSNITSNDFVNTSVIPQDVWELQFFKRPNSV
ncbi:Serine/threonine-protein kinase ATM [Glycine soja]